MAEAAPRESASTPRAPLPQNRSTTCRSSTPPSEPKMSKIDSRTRSEVGRTVRGELGGQPAPAAPASDDPHRLHPRRSAPQLLKRYSPSSSLSSSRTSSARPGCAASCGSSSTSVLGHPARLLEQGQVARVGQRGQPQVALALLAGAQQGPLAADPQVGLGQDEPVGRARHRRPAARCPPRRRAGSTSWPRRPARPGPAAGAAGRSRSGRRSR